jgi:hypothetical protein
MRRKRRPDGRAERPSPARLLHLRPCIDPDTSSTSVTLRASSLRDASGVTHWRNPSSSGATAHADHAAASRRRNEEWTSRASPLTASRHHSVFNRASASVRMASCSGKAESSA